MNPRAVRKTLIVVVAAITIAVAAGFGGSLVMKVSMLLLGGE